MDTAEAAACVFACVLCDWMLTEGPCEGKQLQPEAGRTVSYCSTWTTADG